MRAPARHALASAAAAALLLTACSSGGDNAGKTPAGDTAGNTVGNTSAGNTTGTSARSSATGTNSASSTSGPSSTGAGSSSGSTTSAGSKPGTSGASTSATSSGNGSNNNATVVPNPTDNSRPTSIAATKGTGCVPTRVDVPSVGISEPIVAMGTNSQGQIYPPPRTTMWYDKSPQPGANGVAVVAGHVTYDGPDDFYELDRVKNGAPVTVRCSNGRVLTWKVSAKQSVLKTALQTDQRVWGGSSTPVVALITCDRASKVVGGHHLNNYVVWVRPA